MPHNYMISPHQNRYRWVMLGLTWLLYSMFGLVAYSLAPLVTPIMRDLNISYTQMGIIAGSWPLSYIFISVIAGALTDKLGARISLLAGAVIMGLSMVLRFSADGFVGMFLAVALYGVGGPLISIGCPKVISTWFVGKSRGMAVGIYMTGPRVGGIFALALTNSLVMPLAGFSWRHTFLWYGLVTFAVALLWVSLARETKSPAFSGGDRFGSIFARLMKIRNVQIVLTMGLLSFATMHGFLNWLPKILENRGLSPELAGIMAAVPTLASIPATLIIPRLVPPGLRGRSILLLAVLTALTLFVVVNASGVLLYVGLVVFGFAMMSFLPMLLLILMDMPEVGSKYMGSAAGMFFCVAEVGGFAGPMVMGALVDLTSSFLAGTAVLASMNLVTLAMTFLLKMEPSKD
ncbi:MAG: MFS transporter [Chloroflexota bacterium]|nr:MAG: MFS transporter [Chloroflexota bacterium]